jgi:hypothetical protein
VDFVPAKQKCPRADRAGDGPLGVQLDFELSTSAEHQRFGGLGQRGSRNRASDERHVVARDGRRLKVKA